MKTGGREILTIAEMALADKLTIEGGVAEARLIATAGGQLARAICGMSLPGEPIAVCCGVGNNGADGFACAHDLLLAGRKARILSLRQPEQLKGEARLFAHKTLALLEPEDLLVAEEQTDEKVYRSFLGKAGILTDALFGTGLNRAPEGAAAAVIRAFNRCRGRKVAADLPSGIHGDRATAGGEHIRADLTVTFFRPKLAHYLYPAAHYCGSVVCFPIGIRDDVLNGIRPRHLMNGAHLYADELIRKTPNYLSHKYNRGHVLIFAGEQFGGAGVLACMAAQRAGAGLVSRILADPSSQPPGYAPVSCILRSDEGRTPAQNLADFKAGAALTGPGSGVGKQTAERTLGLLQGKVPLVLDADALSSFESNPEPLKRALRRHGKCVLTPHIAEFRRVFPNITGANKCELALNAAAETGAVIVLKGADTVIAEPLINKGGHKGGKVAVQQSASSYLATGGSGDVLGGMIVSFLAQGMTPFVAACAGTHIHELCGQRAGVNLIAEDLIRVMPDVLTDMIRKLG